VTAIKAGLDLPDEPMRQFGVARPAYAAFIKRVRRNRADAEEPAHTVRPASLSGRGQPR